VKVYVIHENPDWYAPLAAAFDAAGVAHEQWLLGDGILDLDSEPPAGVFWSRMSASSHTRGHPLAKDQARGVLSWLESHGRRVVNGRRVLELEMSKVEQLTSLRAAGFDVPRTVAVTGSGEGAPLLDPELSGIAGTQVEVIFSYDFLLWLVNRFPGELDIDWEDQEPSESFSWVLPLLVPFLSEEASVDANVPYLAWLRAAGALGKDGGLRWLLKNIERLDVANAGTRSASLTPSSPLTEPGYQTRTVRPYIADRLRAALYDSLELWVRWRLGNSPMTRTLMRRPPRRIFYQTTPLVARRDVSIDRELSGRPLRVRKLSLREGEAALDLARAAMATRYRELYSFTWGDPQTVLSADAGRGLEILLVGLLPEKRLPLRAGYAPFVLRNGVPIGYGDAFGLCERMEVSFNIFYAFRDGESAYAFARTLALYHQLFGSTAFSIDPYQIGQGNEEAIDAGAFWFYRKLGFRPTSAAVEEIARREEVRMTKTPGLRTSARTLRKMAGSALVFDQTGKGHWDRFNLRNIGLAVEKRFAAAGEDAAAFAAAALQTVAANLGFRARSIAPRERSALEKLAPVLALIPDLKRWTSDERAALREIIRAKAAPREDSYLHRLAAHQRLRRALLKLGSR